MNDEEFIPIDEATPEPGEYCTIKVVSYFKGKYLPSCKSWSWLMDDNVEPTSMVTGWKREETKENKYEFLPRNNHLQ